MDSTRPLCVWLDMDLYKRVIKLPYLHPELYKDKWIESPGQFHIVLCALRCLGQTVEGSGLDNAWVDADIYSNVTVMQILNGKHHNRAMECHLFTLQALSDLWLDSFFQAYPNLHASLQDNLQNLTDSCKTQVDVSEAHTDLLDTMSALNINDLMDEFDSMNSVYPMYRWARMYMRQVTTLLQFVRSTRQRLWHLHLASLEQLCIWFFAYNRLDYAMNIPEYVARMYELQHTSADVWREFEQGGFTVSTNPISFTAIGVDQAQEHVDKIHKGHGGMSGITNSPEALLRYCLSTPELTRISRETEQMLGMTQAVQTHHHNLCKAKVVRQEKYIKQLKDILSTANPFKVPESTDGTEKKLVHLTNNIIMPQNVQDSILDTEIRGHTAYASFVDDRISGDKNLWDKMTKVKLLSWTSGANCN